MKTAADHLAGKAADAAQPLRAGAAGRQQRHAERQGESEGLSGHRQFLFVFAIDGLNDQGRSFYTNANENYYWPTATGRSIKGSSICCRACAASPTD